MKTVYSLLLLLSALFTSAQQNISTAKADSLFQTNRWQEALAEYTAILKTQPENPYILFKIGKCSFALAKFPEAISFYQSALSHGGRMAINLSVAEAFNKLNKTDSVFAYLQKLADAGFPDYKAVASDSLLSNLFNQEKFKKIISQLKINNAPCTGNEKYRQFDFWIGEWNVTSSGQPVGKSSIKLILDSCVIYENWTGMKEGKSFNMYDTVTGKWKQTWVDYSGAWTEFIDGEYKDSKMVFHTRNDKQADGTFLMRRLSFFNLDSNHVRQFSEMSKDNGVSWSVEYDFLYTRVSSR